MHARTVLFCSSVWYLTASLTIRVLLIGRQDLTPLYANVTLKMAEEQLFRDGVLPSNTEFSYFIEPICDPHISPGRAAQIYIQQGLDVIIGPGCYDGMLPTAKLSGFWNIPVLDYGIANSDLNNRYLFPTLIEMSPSLGYLGTIVENLLYHFNWTRVTLVGFSEPSGLCISSMNSVRTRLWANPNFTIQQDSVLPNMDNDTLDAFFQDIRIKSRVVITCMLMPNDNAEVNTRKFMIRAQLMGCTAPEYQYIALYGTKENMLDQIDYGSPWNSGPNDPDNTSISVAREAFRSLMMLETDGTTVEDMQAMVIQMNDRLTRYPWNIPWWSLPRRTNASWTLPFIYDAMYAYGKALNISLTINGALVPATEFKLYFQLMQFNDLGGRYFIGYLKAFGTSSANLLGQTAMVKLDANTVRISSYSISTVDCNGNFTQAISVEPKDIDGTIGYTTRLLRDLCWPTNNHLPPTGLPAFLPDPGSSTASAGSGAFNILYIILPLLLPLALTIVGVYVYKRKQRQAALAYAALDGHFWNVQFKELMLFRSEPNRLAGSISEFKTLEDNFVYKSQLTAAVSASQGALRKFEGMLISTQEAIDGGIVVDNFVGTAMYAKQLTYVEIYVRNDEPCISQTERQLIREIRSLQHDNLNRLLACSFDEGHSITFVWGRPSRGSFKSVLFNEELQLDDMFKVSMIKDIIRGLEYLHGSSVGVHGSLNLDTCLIDSRWTVKLSRFGVTDILTNLARKNAIYLPERSKSNMHHLAPECLRGLVTASIQADMYAFAMLVYQILFRVELFEDVDSTATDTNVLQKIQRDTNDAKIQRPPLPPPGYKKEGDKEFFYDLIRRCWRESPVARLTAKQARDQIYEQTKNKSHDLMDHMIEMLGRYATNLENIVGERTQQLQEEKKRADALLCRMLPPSIATDLKMGKAIEPESFDLVTVFFSDIVQFTSLSATSTPMEMVNMLNLLYSTIDDVIAKYDAYKVETIGDAYMIVSGLPKRNELKHVTEIANLALEIRQVFKGFVIPHRPGRQLELRIGIHSGPVAAGVIGQSMPRYCLFGDTVNTASRMESNGLPMKIQLSAETYKLLRYKREYSLSCRGTVEIKGKGECVTYWLEASRFHNVLKHKATVAIEQVDVA